MSDPSLYREVDDSSPPGLRPSVRNDSRVRFDRRSGERAAFSDEQAAAIRVRAPVISVSAGAGSGKTTVLVERFIDLVQRDGVSPLEILAITFTEKAAAEMKERIVRRFEERGDVANRRQAEAAYISTIHGFCSRILRENPLAARLDPSFGVMDEVTRNVFFDEHLERLYGDDWYVDHEGLFSKRWDSDRPRLFELIVEAAFLPAEFGTAVPTEAHLTIDEHLAAAVRRVTGHWDSEWSAARDRLLAARLLIEGAEVSGRKRAESHETMCGVLRSLASDGRRNAGLAAEFLANTGFTAGVKDEVYRDEIKSVFDAVRPTFKACAELDLSEVERTEREIFAPIKVEIYKHADALRGTYEEFKRLHGLLDFEDMQRRALGLLADTAVQQRYGRQFRHILLDEAQDTNDVQMRLIEHLLGDDRSLFAVGDAKQSIYGFRGAVGVIPSALVIPSAARDRDHPGRGPSAGMSAIPRSARNDSLGTTSIPRLTARNDSMSICLTDNYRSRSGILDVVNEIGERFWQEGTIEYEALTAKFAYEPHGQDPRVDVWFIEQPMLIDEDGNEKLEPADDTREREGVALASWIRATVDGAEPLIVYDRSTASYRPARYGDIAILSNTRTPFPAYERALADLGIPFVKDGGREFFSGREVQDLLAALRVIENPLDEPSLLAALRSPLFGWGDRDLTRLRAEAGGRSLWAGMRSFAPNEATAAPDAYETIRRLRREAGFVPPVELVERVCDVTAYRAALLLLPRGRAQVANIDKLIEFARVTAALDGPSLSAFLHRATLAEKYLGRETDAPANSVGDDVVVLSTIHGAKGLEWPIVILAGLDADYARTDVLTRYSAPDGALILQIKEEDGTIVRSEANVALNANARARDEAEGRRLFYVGMTRARERLIMSSRYGYPERTNGRPGLSVPIKWLAAELGIMAPEPNARVAKLGDADVRVDFFSPERIAPMRDEVHALHDAKLAEARRAVREGRPVDWDGQDGAPPDGNVLPAVERVLSQTAPEWAAQRSLALTTVTQLVYFFRCPLVYYFDLVLQIDEHPKGRGKVATTEKRRSTALERGSRVHELLEHADFSAEPNVEARRLAAQLADVSDEDRAQITSLLDNILVDPLIARVRSAVRLEREYPFYLDLGGTTVQGVIDLVFEDAHGKGVVVDYKSNDLAAPGRLETLTELYRPQIELYALAAKQAGLVEPNEGTLYFLNKARAVTTQLDARRLATVEEEASKAVDQIARSAWDTEPGEKCRACGYRKRGYCEVGKRFVE